MEKMSKGKLLESIPGASNIKEESAEDIPADDIENNRDLHSNSETDSDSSSDSNSNSDSDSEYECEVCNKTFSGYLPFKQHQKGKKHAKTILRKKKEKKLLKIDTAAENGEEKLIQEPYAECKVCNKEFYDPGAYGQHLKCRKHIRKVLEASILEQVQEGGKINVEKLQEMHKSKPTADDVEYSKDKLTALTLEDEEENNEEFECKECEKIFSGLTPFTQHLMSKTHAKKIEKKNLLQRVIPGTSKDDETSVKSKQNVVRTLSIEDDILVCKVCSTAFSGPESAMAHMKSKKHTKNLDKHVRKLKKKQEKEKDKSVDLNSDEKSEVTPVNENQNETPKVKLQQNSDHSDGLEESDGFKKNAVQSTSSGTQVTEGLIGYEVYKEYKSLMNTLFEDEP